jgi:hypothetical protein
MVNNQHLTAYIDELVGSDPDNVQRILTALEDACYATGEHCATNWQDDAARGAWQRIAKAVLKARQTFDQHKPY